jgi:hypothetical protein
LEAKKSEILMFRASKHESTFQKTQFDIFLKKPKKKKKKKKDLKCAEFNSKNIFGSKKKWNFDV